MTPWYRTGKTGWLAVIALILAWDLLAEDEQQLTDSFRRGWRRHPVSGAAVLATWAVVTAHLWHVLPEKADPIHLIYVVRAATRKGPGGG